MLALIRIGCGIGVQTNFKRPPPRVVDKPGVVDTKCVGFTCSFCVTFP